MTTGNNLCQSMFMSGGGGGGGVRKRHVQTAQAVRKQTS